METEICTVAEVIDMDIYEPVIAEMKAQIEECERVIVTLEMMRSKGISTAPKAASNSSASTATFSNDAFFGMTIADAARKYLTGIKKTATARSIAENLLAGGMKSASKTPVENIRSILSRHANFALVNGEFGLAEWYPGRKAVKRQSSTSVTNEEADDVIVSHGAENSFVEQERRESA